MKLSRWAKCQGIHYQTAWQWFKDGRIPGSYRTDTGSIFVEEPIDAGRASRVVVYARVSNRERKESLTTQVARCVEFANARGLSVAQIYKEVGSGMNESRRELWRMLDSKPTCIVVEHRDRLARFGCIFIEKLLADSGCTILVLDPTELEDDLLRDLTSIIYSFCARLYGKRRAKNKLKDIQTCLQ